MESLWNNLANEVKNMSDSNFQSFVSECEKTPDIPIHLTETDPVEGRKILNHYLSDLVFILQDSMKQEDLEIVYDNLWDVRHYLDMAMAQCKLLYKDTPL